MTLILRVRRSFAARIAALAFVSGLATLFGVIVFLGTFSTAPTGLKVVPLVGAVLGLPLLLGWLAARLVVRPLRSFARAIAAVQDEQYDAPLAGSGITEFDTVFRRFNALTARLRREEALRKDLISDASHELFTPLAALSGQLIAMQEGQLPPSAERFQLLRDQVDRLTELVERLDTYTRARAPRTPPIASLHLASLCARVVSEFGPTFEDHSMRVVLAIPDSLYVRGDQQAVEQILLNLLQNALRYSGATVIRIVADTERWLIADNGVGVPPASLPYLFERFYRVDQSRNRGAGGLGLGLAIVRELVGQQGWTISAEESRPGLAFTIHFHP